MALTSVFSTHYSPFRPGPLLCLPHGYPGGLRSHDLRSFPRNDESYLFGYLDRYFASNEQSSLSGSLPSNKSGSVPRSLPHRSPHSGPSSFPEYSTGNFLINTWSLLERNRNSPWLRRRPTHWACD